MIISPGDYVEIGPKFPTNEVWKGCIGIVEERLEENVKVLHIRLLHALDMSKLPRYVKYGRQPYGSPTIAINEISLPIPYAIKEYKEDILKKINPNALILM